MLKRRFKFTLMITSLSPVLAIFGIMQLRCFDWSKFDIFSLSTILSVIFYLIIPCVLAIRCYTITNELSKSGEIFSLRIKEFSRRDHGILSFIFIYLFPFIISPSPLLVFDYVMYGCVFIIITIIMTDIGSYNFNPIMRLFKYKIYSVKDEHNINILLITKNTLRDHDPIDIRRISHDVYIEAETK